MLLLQDALVAGVQESTLNTCMLSQLSVDLIFQSKPVSVTGLDLQFLLLSRFEHVADPLQIVAV